MPVSLPGVGVSLPSIGVSLRSSVYPLPVGGESLEGSVSISSHGGGPPPLMGNQFVGKDYVTGAYLNPIQSNRLIDHEIVYKQYTTGSYLNPVLSDHLIDHEIVYKLYVLAAYLSEP